MLKDLILKNRSYRRFHQEVKIDMATLRELVDLARVTPSASNLQPLKYLLSNEPKQNALIFAHLAWAGYLKEWGGPAEGERPAAYIIVLKDTTITQATGCDHGIVAQSIMLGAVEKGLGGCMLASVKRNELKAELHIPDHLEILLVLALGKPKEQVVLEKIATDGNIKYWRDEKQVHHVPKRTLEEIIID